MVLSGRVIHCDSLRYTPAGLPLLSFVINHASESIEAGLKRKVECDVNAVAIGDIAKTNVQVGSPLKVSGFIAKRSAKSSQLVLHIQNIELM